MTEKLTFLESRCGEETVYLYRSIIILSMLNVFMEIKSNLSITPWLVIYPFRFHIFTITRFWMDSLKFEFKRIHYVPRMETIVTRHCRMRLMVIYTFMVFVYYYYVTVDISLWTITESNNFKLYLANCNS